jgi:hypothetical protein
MVRCQHSQDNKSHTCQNKDSIRNYKKKIEEIQADEIQGSPEVWTISNIEFNGENIPNFWPTLYKALWS